MKKRVFFSVLLLFYLFFNGTLMVISLISLHDNLSAVRERCLSEHYVIASALIGDIQALELRGGDSMNAMDDLMTVYARYSQNRKSGLAVSYEEAWVYQTKRLLPGVSPADLEASGGSSGRIAFVENNPEPVFCVYGRFPAPYQDYGFLYTSDLSEPLSSWRQMKNTLLLIGAFVTLILAICLLAFLEIIFRPLGQISRTSATIAGGDYHSRLLVRGRDEVADMASSFNLMADKVEAHIRLLQKAADQKQQFVDNFAHELRTPLTAIYGYAEYMQKANLSEEEGYECTQFIMSECKRLQNMAYQLLELAAMREITMEDCSVPVLFRSSSELMQRKAAQKQIRLVYDAQTDRIEGNQELLLSLLNNLIDNAIKASSPGDEVRISSFWKEGHTVMEVKDNGLGMSKEQIPHIKEAFYRVDKGRSRALGGAGLGLSICNQIAGLHDAELTFSSELGKGTAARILFKKRENFTT